MELKLQSKNFVQFLVFSNFIEGLFNLSGLNRGLKFWKGLCVSVSCCTLVAHVKEVLIKGDAGFAVYGQLWIFIWKKTDFVGPQVHGKKLLPQWLPCVEPQFPVVNKSFYLRGVLNGHAIQSLFSQVWKLVWPSFGLQSQVEVKAGRSSLQTEGQSWCAHKLLNVHWIQRVLVLYQIEKFHKKLTCIQFFLWWCDKLTNNHILWRCACFSTRHGLSE